MEVTMIFYGIAILIISLAVLAVILFFAFVVFVMWFLSRLFDSIQPVPPAPGSKANSNEERNPLLRHVPALRSKLAWEELGTFPTPIHRAKLEKDGRVHSFYMKREDLSSPLYGGNKVRTLQYQLPAIRAQLDKDPSSEFYVLGSGGSNQVVATLAHGAKLGLKFHIKYAAKDGADLDNTINLLSTLSFGPLSLTLWDKVLPQIRRLLAVVLSDKDKAFGLGGNSLGGILGQMGAALELAEQIEAGELPDPDEIYLPLGSSCTTTGLIMGVCLARHLKLNAFRSPHFKIVSVVIHGGLAALNRKTNVYRNLVGSYFFVSPRFGIRKVSAYLKENAGIDLEQTALEFLENEWDLVDAAEYAGEYGIHCEKSAAASAFDRDLEVTGTCPPWVSAPALPWLCGHFTGKSFAVMLDRLEARQEPRNVLFWQTKSAIQPLGSEDEWTEFQRMTSESKVLKEWSDSGEAASKLRPGKVDVDNGSPADYRHIMKKVLVK